MNITPHTHVHRRTMLTDKCLIEADGAYDFNFDYWVRLDHVFITTDVTERLDRSAGPAAFVGHFVIKSKPFTLAEYEQAKQTLQAAITTKIDEVIDAKQYAPITQPPQQHKL